MSGRLEHELKVENTIRNNLKNAPPYVIEWHNGLKASKKTSETRKDYVNKICRFLSSINKDISKVSYSDINYDSVCNYFISIQTKNKNGKVVYTSDSYQQTVWTVLNNFIGFLYNKEYIKQNYMKFIDKPKNHDLERINENRKLLTKKDFSKILNSIEQGVGTDRAKTKQKSYVHRDKAILMLLMSTGMRKEALCEIDISDVDIDNHCLTIIDKGNKRHRYKLSEEVLNEILWWLEKRNNIKNNTDALFISYQGTRLHGNSVSKIVEKYSDDALGYPISPHKLRAGFCSILYNETHDAEFVRRAVGHSNISTTQRYITTDGKEKEVASDIISSIF